MILSLRRRALRALLPCFGVACLLASREAAAQQPPPQGPPPGFEQAPTQQPPQGYPQPGYAQPGYPPQPGYAPPAYYPQPYAQQQLGPKTMEYEEGQPVPPGYHPETRVRKGMIIGGAVTFGALYLISALTAATVHDTCDAVGSSSCSNSLTPLYIPAVGPFVAIGTSHADALGSFALVVDGVAQTGGLALAIAGFVATQSLLVRNDVGKATITPMPIVSRNMMGLGFVGHL